MYFAHSYRFWKHGLSENTQAVWRP